MKYVCQTLFDITATGVTGHCKLNRMPFQDHTNRWITDQPEWNRARNQQRNWETLTQILSLRTQLFELALPVKDTTGTSWMFEFETESSGTFGDEDDPVKVLRQDAEGVPMLLDLDNRSDLLPVLCTAGENQNIWFAISK
jgi:hypothetical protein